ncbi:MAG: WecB/TagA/CpsF family glycosyltransferase [Bacteroidaceae bacterium]|nr:WecB/TagA/CpsF family glycosyltransferase [Bacteroidaceae bacterium]
MKQHFNIQYEFDVPTVHQAIEEQLAQEQPDYICVADGNILTMVHNDEDYRAVINDGMFSICDSSWVPKFIKWIYGHNYKHYCGSDIFIDIVRSRKYRMMFLGTKQNVLDALRENLAKENPDVSDMTFKELPFCTVDEFDYAGIAEMVNNDGAEIIWVALGAPKQEIFMNRLKPHLNKGVMIAIGAAFNFYSGLADAPQRCPAWMRKLHLEFVHRIFKEPKKQIRRCWHIVTTLPQILRKERQIKKKCA